MIYYHARFDTLVPLHSDTDLDDLRYMTYRVLCYPAHTIAALSPNDADCWEATKQHTGIDPTRLWS